MATTQIKNYDVMFALRTGVTILVPKNDAFTVKNEADIVFSIQADDVLINTPSADLILKNLKKDCLSEAQNRGFIMFYELDDDDEVVRCTPCLIKPS